MITRTNTFTAVFNQPVEAEQGTTVDISRVVIPGIQRAYAHGRTSRKESKIRKGILDSIFECLQSPSHIVKDFHFIYGAVTLGNDGEYQLELLDGQQRFTTLYLLHWYLINREFECLDYNRIEHLEKALSSFSYKTRNTSTEFCKSLVNYRCDLSDRRTPSQAIKGTRWYYNRFDNDSTIQGMLVMLDEIHKRYNACCGNKNKGLRLIYRTERLQFYVLPLMDYKMSEELYIKMNARGLPLAAFDNFKSELTGAMKSAPSLSGTVSLPDGSLVSHQERISIHLDSKWIDLFWKPGITDYDVHYMRFFSRFFAYRYMLDSGLAAEQMQNTELPINVFYTQSEDKENRNEYLGFEAYQDALKGHSDYFEKIEKVLDTLHDSNNMLAIHNTLRPIWEPKRQGNFFIDADVPFSQSLLVVFGAICDYIIELPTFDEKLFRQWMRVVWNVVENTNIDSLAAATGPLRNLHHLLTQIAPATPVTISDFYRSLAGATGISRSNAVEEEIEKARCIAADQKWLAELIDAEKHPYLKGAVGFFYDKSPALDQFIHNRDLVKSMFDKDGIVPEYRERHLLIRAIVSNIKVWDDRRPQYRLRDRYITENAETNKRLKLLLLGNDDVRQMFVNVLLNSSNAVDVKRQLNQVIIMNRMSIDTDPQNYWENKFVFTHNVLCDDVKLYDWMATKTSPVCVYEYKGHFAVSIRGVWYDRFMIDSERDQMALSLMSACGMSLYYLGDSAEHATQDVFNQYRRFMGTEIILYRNLDATGDLSFRVGFMQDHNLRVYLQCTDDKQCPKMQDEIDQLGLSVKTQVNKDDKKQLYLDVDDKGELLPDFRYLLKERFDNKLKNMIRSRLLAVERAMNP